MDAKTHWIFEEFFAGAPAMRQAIDDHFNEKLAKRLPFRKRAVWNYWFIDPVYTYLRTLPSQFFPALYQQFMLHLRRFAEVNFGMSIPSEPYLSMYVNGCGQAIHNDAGNGRLAFVFSLTNWKTRRFEGGETIIFKAHDAERSFRRAPGSDFYQLVAPEFNRLVIFDDRIAHGVRSIQGNMNPGDARFVIHGHMVEPLGFAYKQGGLRDVETLESWKPMHDRVKTIIQSHGYHGFVTTEIRVTPSGSTSYAGCRHTQLLPLSSEAKSLDLCVAEILNALTRESWPTAETESTLVTAFGSSELEKHL